MRINVFLAQQLGISRRAADSIIQEKRVAVNGKRAKLGQPVDPQKDRVSVDGKPITAKQQKRITIALYKPKGYVTTRSDPKKRKTVMHLLPNEFQHLKPIGRLDYDSEGLLLLTNNGDLLHKLTHPKYQKEKEYRLVFTQPVTKHLTEAFSKGIRLTEGLAKADSVAQSDKNEIRLVLHQGWNRQLRRMAEACHYEVSRLIRTRMAGIGLEGLQPGQWRTVKGL